MADRRVLFFGDSHVAGVGDPSGLGWVGRVVAASFAAGTPLTAYNLGVRGETSVHVAARWRQETGPRLFPGADTRIVMSFGANDTTMDGGRGRVAAESSCGALAGVLDRARAINLPVLVVGPAPVHEADQNERLHSLSASFGDVCGEHLVGFLSVIEPLLASRAWMHEVAEGDGAHPGAPSPGMSSSTAGSTGSAPPRAGRDGLSRRSLLTALAKPPTPIADSYHRTVSTRAVFHLYGREDMSAAHDGEGASVTSSGRHHGGVSLSAARLPALGRLGTKR